MVNGPTTNDPDGPMASPRGGAFLSVDVERLYAWLRAGLWIIIACTILGAALALAYSTLTAPRYTATAEIIVDPANLQIVPDDLYAASQQRDVPLLSVDSKLRVLTSRNVLARVVDRLNLQADPEFNVPPSPYGIRALIFGLGPDRDGALKARETLAARVGASRDERSFAVTLSVWSHDAEKAVDISNAIIEAFQDELADGEAAGASRAANSLLDRLSELRGEVTVAEGRVETFRRENGLQLSGGELISTRSMGEMNALIVAAQAQLSAAESRYNALTAAASNPQANNTVLQSGTIGALRQQYATLSQLAASQAQVYGPRHPNRLALEPQLRSVEQEIANETSRIVNAARDEAEQARANLAALRASAENNRSVVENDNAAEVQLRELQRDAAAKAAVYEAFLGRARQVSEAQEIDSTNIRVISPAVVPVDRSWPPRTSRLGIVGLIAGFGLGAMIAIGRGVAADLRPAPARAPVAPVMPTRAEPDTQGAEASVMPSDTAEFGEPTVPEPPVPRADTYSSLAPDTSVAAETDPVDEPYSNRRRTAAGRSRGSLLDYL